MFHLYDFKFKYFDPCTDQMIFYLILEIRGDRYYLQCYNNGTICSIDISDKVEMFCNMLLEIGINDWNMKNYDGSMKWFAIFQWTLDIVSDNINVHCQEQYIFPPNWEGFKTALTAIGIAGLDNIL